MFDFEVHVPGAKAPTVKVPALVNSMPRHLLKHGSVLGSFVKSILSCKPSSRDERPQHGALWPIPVPYPEAFDGGVRDGGPNWRKRRICLLVLLMDWLFLGKPAAAPDCLSLGSRLSGKQWRRIRLMEYLVEDQNSLFEVDAECMARTAAKTEAASDELSSLHRALAFANQSFGGRGSDSGGNASITPFDVGDEIAHAFGCYEDEVRTETFVAAKPIKSSRIVFSGSPEFDPLPYMDEETCYAFDRPLDRAEGHNPAGTPPAVSVHASRTERNLLFRKMAQTGRLKPIVDLASVRPSCFSGLFAVGKDLERDRLILDARPPNLAEPGLSKWTMCMASATCLSGLELGKSQLLAMSGRDIKDFFYQFKVSEQRCLRNVMATWMTPEDLEFVFEEKFSSGGYVGLNTLAMGDLSACEYAQASHMGILMKSGGCFPDEVMKLNSPCPRNDLSIGIVIDDLICLEKINFKLSGGLDGKLLESGESRTRMEAIMEEYTAASLPVNLKKSFDCKLQASFWGVQVDGVKGVFRANDSRFWPLVLITLRVACLGLSTVSLLQSLAGSWISVLCIRRRLLSLMNLIFDAIACASGPSQVVRLSGALIDELFSFCIGGMMAFCNLRAELLSQVRASDASNWGMAAVCAEVPERVAREAMRWSLSRSLWSRLLPPRKAWLRSHGLLSVEEELPGDEVFDAHPLWTALARCYVYRERWRRQHPRSVHINVGELRGALREELRLASDVTAARAPFALDSQVALGALVKGRASSRALNSELQRSLGPLLFSDLYFGYGYWPSELNRADAPTRDADVPPPDMEKPQWLLELESGDYQSFDRWVFATGVDAGRADLEQCYERMQRKPVDIRPAVKLEPDERRSELEKGKPVKPGDGAEVSLRVDDVFSAEAKEVLLSFDLEQYDFAGGEPLISSPGALDLYSGVGGVRKALVKGGCPWCLSFEIKRSSKEDLLDKDVQRKILVLIHCKVVALVGSAIVCRSFSIAVTPPVRSSRFPRGVPWMSLNMKPKVKEGNVMSDFQADVHTACDACGCYFWTENPDGSHLWRQRKFKKFKYSGSKNLARFDMCRFGTRWRKRTRVATNIPDLMGLRMLCKCKGLHVPLRGQHPSKKIPWTLVAQAYPRGFSRLVACGAINACGWSKGGKFDVAGCARCTSQRIGEASNPGPRSNRVERGFSLEECPVQSFASLQLGERRWQLFYGWSKHFLRSCEPLDLYLRVPILLAHAVRRYGDEEFISNGSLSYYRHLVLAALRKVPTMRPYVSICWDLATRWSCVEPVQHRAPIPERLTEALASLSYVLGWRRWTGVLLLCHYGVARAGEVLLCKRRDLLLPGDLMDETTNAAYLMLRRSKTMHRQAARVQHLKIESESAVRMLVQIFGEADREEMLYCGSPGVFRKRWDHLLTKLSIPADLHLTPGGLRGGGCVTLYRKGCSVSDILWRMRLKNITTLEAYLQEVAAISILTSLPDESRKAVRSAAALFPVLAAS